MNLEFVQNSFIRFLDNDLKPSQKDRLITVIQSFGSSFEVRHCAEFDIGYTNPVASESSAHLLYSDKSSGNFDEDKSFVAKIKNYLGKKLLKKITRDCQVDDILDFATGNGRFAHLSSKLFPKANVVATDFYEDVPMLIRGNERIKYHRLESVWSDLPGRYDAIILRHVLEHSYDPIRLLTGLANSLKPSGIIYIEVPNLNSGCSSVFKKYCTLFYVPYHIFHFTEKSLSSILDKAGLSGEVCKQEMPIMGNVCAAIIGCDNNLFTRIIAILLHPIQLLIEVFYRSSTCLSVRAKLKTNDQTF